MDTITSLKNDKVKLAKGLQTRPRARRKELKIVLEGTRLVRDAVERQHRPFFVFFDPKTVDYHLLALLQQHEFEIIPVNDEVIQHISETSNPQGIIGIFPLPIPPLPKNPQRALILDNLRDPGNMGTIFRTAAAAGVDVVILSPGCADPYNPKTLRSGMGAHFRVPIVEAEWKHIMGYCESLTVYLTSANGSLAYDQVDWLSPWAVIIGSEAHGGGSDSERIADHRICIPMAAETESINAAIAAGVVLFEAARQSKRAVGD